MARQTNVEETVWGSEPVVREITDINSKEFRSILGWYNQFSEIENSKKWISVWMKKGYTHEQIANFNSNCKHIATSYAVIARLINRETKVPIELVNRLKSELEQYLVKEKTVSDRNTPNVQDRIQEKISDCIGDIESILDQFYINNYTYQKPNVYDILVTHNIKGSQSKSILEYYTDLLNEVTTNSSDEYYSRLTKKQIKNYIQFLTDICFDITKYSQNIIIKKSRKKNSKEKSAIQLTKKIKYRKTDTEYKLVSVDPINIIKAMVVIAFVPKYKKIIKYEAIDNTGLSIKGSTIQNFSIEESVAKVIRRPNDILNEFMSGAKSSLNKKMESIKSKSSIPSGRINGEVLILRCLK